MAPYPTSFEIEDIFKWRESPETMSKFDEKIAKNLDATVMGNDHHLAGHHKGADAWKEDNRARMADMLDPSKGVSLDVSVIGGGDTPWACVEMKTTGKAKSGEPSIHTCLSCLKRGRLMHLKGKKWNHEYVAVVRFNLDGKITAMRVYMDSAHMNDHLEEHKKIQRPS